LLSTQSGTEGIFGIALPSLGLPFLVLTSTGEFYWLVYVIVLICVLALRRFVNTPVGYALRGIRQNDVRMEALGFNTWAYRYLSFIVGAAFAGIAGVLLTYHNGFVVPGNLGADQSTVALVMVLIGGPGTLVGPVVGAAVIILLEFIVSSTLPERWPLVLGASYVVAVISARSGLTARLRQWYRLIAKNK
jgi:branched-chain amino acid transport system permease protein